jgi:uncharacterized protein YbjT (DUF2867 family)
MILLTGASGTLGVETAKQLVEKQQKFKCFVRKTSNVEALEAMGAPLCYGDLGDRASLEQAMEGVTSVISTHTLGISKKEVFVWDIDYQGNKDLIELLVENGGGKFVYISSLGVALDSPYAIFTIKCMIENLLKVSGLDYTVFRPAGFFSDFTMSAKIVKKYHIYPAIGGSDHPIQAIHQGDIAICAVDALRNPKASKQIFPIGGPEQITSATIAAVYAASLGHNVRIVPVPAAVPKAVAKVVDAVTGNRYNIYGMADAFTSANLSDNTKLLDTFAVTLRTFEPYLKEFLERG